MGPMVGTRVGLIEGSDCGETVAGLMEGSVLMGARVGEKTQADESYGDD